MAVEDHAALDVDTLRTALAGPAGERLARQLLDEVAARYGEAPLVARVLAERPGVYVPAALKNQAAVRDSLLGAKVAELVAVGAASALQCEHCIRTHSEQALRAGATLDEVFAAMLIAGTIAESAVQSFAFREYQRLKRRAEEYDSFTTETTEP
jgi:AhpD family alkylhydroperoxidase